MKNTNVFYYITDKNLSKAAKLAQSWGYPKPKAKNDEDFKLRVSAYLADYYKKNKNDPGTIISIVDIHPDTAMIQNALLIKKSREAQAKPSADGEWSNCSACGLLGADAVKPASKLTNQNINLLIIAGSAILMGGLIAIIVKSNN